MGDFRKVVSVGGLFEKPPPTLQRTTRENRFESVVRYVLRPLWGWRVELAALAGGMALWAVGASRIGTVGASAVAVGLIVGCAAWPKSRRVASWVLGRARLRRRWALAVRHAGLATPNDCWPPR